MLPVSHLCMLSSTEWPFLIICCLIFLLLCILMCLTLWISLLCFVHFNCLEILIEIVKKKEMKENMIVYFLQPQGWMFVSVFLLESIRGRADVGEESSQRWSEVNTTIYSGCWKTNRKHWFYHLHRPPESSLQLMFTWHKINSILDRRLLLCISFATLAPVYVCLWPVPTPNFPHHIQSRPANGQLHYSQYLKSPLMRFPAVCSSVSSESQSFKCSCADCGCRW